jgi:hypothetical protein
MRLRTTFAWVFVGWLAVCGSSLPAHGGEIVLTSGVVHHVDIDHGVVVLDSGRKLEVRKLMRDGKIIDLGAVRPRDEVFVSGIDLGVDRTLATATSR